jgi:hypothetical protein
MKTFCRILFFSLIIGVALMCGRAAAGVLYELSPGTTYQEGCVGPCLCPVMMSEEVSGTFLLTKQKSNDPWFARYRLSRIAWTVTDPDGAIIHTITGRGTYQVGGDFALTHQLLLDVRIDGGELQHLDSGMIPGGSEFPAIAISVDRGTQCYDIWMDIKASPVKVK